VPIPAFYCAKCRKLFLNQPSFDAVKALFAKGGADAWFTTDAREILPAGTTCDCGSAEFSKEQDIFDVWFESAASHRAVSMKRPELHFPAELYLEGTDQHRGWFQVSLLASLLSNDRLPFKEVVTHGFLVDARTGDKLSKSGFLIAVDEVVSKVGAELLRLWIASIDFTDDLPMSWEILKERAEPYKKIRNTFRYLLGSIHDFDPAKDRVRELMDIDRWAIAELNGLVQRVTRHFEKYEFFRATHELHQFCVVNMSSLYFDILKDRLYTCGRDSRERRSGQTALHEILATLVRLYAPILCHTAEEIWSYLPDRETESVHLARWPQAVACDPDGRWERVWKVRAEVTREIEKLRVSGAIGKSLEAKVTLHSSDTETRKALESMELTAILIVSEVIVADGPVGTESVDLKGFSVRVEKSPHPKCDRCWNLRADVGRNATHPTICQRCVAVVLPL
jgi:isoleucyl-tRNA synthetase